MANDQDYPADLKPIEAALSGLVPAAARVDRDRLMYLAGAAGHESMKSGSAVDGSLRRRFSTKSFLWPLSTAALVLVSVLGALVAFRGTIERLVYVDRPGIKTNGPETAVVPRSSANLVPATHTNEPTNADYLVLRDRVLRNGVGVLDRRQGDTGNAGGEEIRNRALLRELLGS
jgi:hypothetical protein